MFGLLSSFAPSPFCARRRVAALSDRADFAVCVASTCYSGSAVSVQGIVIIFYPPVASRMLSEQLAARCFLKLSCPVH